MLKLKENIGEKYPEIDIGKIFIGNDTRRGKKKRQMGLYQTKKLLHNKENSQPSEEKAYIMEGNIFKSYIS